MMGGLDSETSYTLSDLYIKRADTTQSKEELFRIHDDMVKDYVKRISMLHKQSVFSRPVLRTIDYVDRHLHGTIRLEDIAEYASISPNYLSSLFAKEMNMTISRYIRRRRVEASKSLLQYYDYTITEIAEYLDFSSVSHFIKVFKEETGFTPAKYKEQSFRTWK